VAAVAAVAAVALKNRLEPWHSAAKLNMKLVTCHAESQTPKSPAKHGGSSIEDSSLIHL